jgi:hypothetical protein
MEELLNVLAAEARMQQAVAMNTLDNGMHVFVYPLDDGMLVALGVGAAAQVQPEALLRKRGQDPARFGAWLPAVFNDGSLYLLRRMTEHGDDMSALSAAQWAAAGELLN